jgi:hypothetical protein
VLAGQAREIARAWATTHARDLPSCVGAFHTGSITTLPDAAIVPATSDVDVMIVLDGPIPSTRPGKVHCQGVLLEISYLSHGRIRSAEQVLGDYHLATHLSRPNVILDPTGQLTELQQAVAGEFANRPWVSRRCQQALAKSTDYLDSALAPKPFHEQVTIWVFGAGVTTHVLLVAAFRNPTIRLRYVAVRELLALYKLREHYDELLAMVGCAEMPPSQVQDHLDALAEAFDAASAVIQTPVFFAADLSQHARPIAIDGSRDLIGRGLHREAIFWIVATYARCLAVLHLDVPPELAHRFDDGFRRLLSDLGIGSFGDLQRRCQQTNTQLPRVKALADAIMARNSEIKG